MRCDGERPWPGPYSTGRRSLRASQTGIAGIINRAMNASLWLGHIAVIFTSRRTAEDDAGYAQAAEAMAALAATQPGCAGFVSTRGTDGLGITISYWQDDASAIAWRDHPEHQAIRERGRALWYSEYEIVVARVERGYAWRR